MQFYRSELKKTIKLAIPVVIGQLGHMMMGVVDSIMVGKIGAVPLAAASIAHGIFMLFMIFGIGVSTALSPLVAMRVGAQKYTECGIVFRQGLLVNMIIGIVLLGASYFGAHIIYHLDQPPEIIDQAIAYMQTLALSILPIMLFQTYRQFIEGLSVMRPAMIITLMANLLNIFGNWLFIFGNLGFPAMGLVGAGWATFSTRAAMALAIVFFVTRSTKFKPYDPSLHYRKVDLEMIRKILRLGIPSGLQYFLEIGAFVGSSIVIGWMGTIGLAAHQIAINLSGISFMFPLGVSAAASIRVGNAVGRKDISGARSAGFSAFLLAVLIMCCFGLIFFFFRKILPSFYIEDIEVINIASSLLIIAAIFQLSDGIQAVGVGVLRGIADAKIPTIFIFIAYWVIGLPGGYLLGITFNFGVQGVWFSFLLALTASAVMLLLRFNLKSKHEILI